ncbi:MAG: PH domain-containing protein [Candidatus Aenigmarchaeota archaeon]|nr:PH domain-containing protein [Candidatus Aenigmarchaeota archaeon]
MTIDKPLYELKPSRISFVTNYFLSAVLVSIVGAVKALGLYINEVGIAAAGGLVLILLVIPEIARVRHLYKITPSQVVQEVGILKKQRDSIFLNNIADLNSDQNFSQRLLMFGDIKIGSSSGAEKIVLKGIRNPREIVIELERLMHEYGKDK